MKFKNLIFLVLFSFFILGSCKDNNREVETIEPEEQAEAFEEDLEEVRENDGIVVAVESDPELSTFSTGLNAWNVGDELSDDNGPFTIFAPTNMAYSTLYRDHGRDVLQVNNDAIIKYHIVPGKMTADELKKKVTDAGGETMIETMGGEELTISLKGDKLILKDSNGDMANVTGSSTSDHGIIHIIDKVLLPTDMQVEITTEK